MTEWVVDGLGFLLLCLGMRMGQPRFLRILCSIALAYLVLFCAGYFIWLKWQYHDFQAHPDILPVGIAAAFIFEGFWRLMASMLLLNAIMPLAVIFMLYFAIKWFVTPAST